MTDTFNDEFLLEKARSGDQSAFFVLYERHRSSIFRFLYRLLDSAEIAKAITHDSFLSLIRESEKSKSHSTAMLRTRLYSTARTLAMEYLRNLAQETNVKDVVKDYGISRRNKQSIEIHDGGLVSEVREAIASMPPLEREVLIFSNYEGLELDAIAAIVGTDVETVAARLGSARQRLRNALANHLNNRPLNNFRD